MVKKQICRGWVVGDALEFERNFYVLLVREQSRLLLWLYYPWGTHFKTVTVVKEEELDFFVYFSLHWVILCIITCLNQLGIFLVSTDKSYCCLLLLRNFSYLLADFLISSDSFSFFVTFGLMSYTVTVRTFCSKFGLLYGLF